MKSSQDEGYEFSLAIPFQTNWLIAVIIMLASMLIGRFVVAVKYR